MLQTETIVIKISEFLRDLGHKLVIDRGFGSVQLVRELSKLGFRTLATIIHTRREFPDELKPKTIKRRDGMVLENDELIRAVQNQDGITVCAWKSKRVVYHITDFHALLLSKRKSSEKVGLPKQSTVQF